MITEPLPFPEAIGFLLNKEDLPADWDAAMWQAQEEDFQTKAFFSANVENARFLDRAHGLLFDYMAKVRETIVQPDGTVVTALKVAGREHFVKRMRDFMIAEGMARHDEFKSVNQKDVTDIRSLARLRLIFDTNVRQAYGFGQWKQGMTPGALKAFPAARLIRDRGVKEPRPRHQNNLGEVLLKTDPRWAEFHNAKEIGGFGVPWGPYGFNSGCTQEDVTRSEARKLGLNVDSVFPQTAKITDGTEASTKTMDPEIKRKLLEELRAGKAARAANRKTPEEYAREAAAKVRREMLSRGLANAEQRGDTAKAAKYRKAIAELPEPGLKVRNDGDKIVLETAPGNAIVPPLPDEQTSHSDQGQKNEMGGIPFHPGRPGEDQGTDTRTTAEAVRTASRKVYSGWTEPKSDSDPGDLDERAIEAHVAAAAEGRKPLYFEPWDNEDVASRFAHEYRKVLPPEVEVRSTNGTVFVYRPEVVRPILDADPGFYRREGESDFDSIARVSQDYENGELLGYGARTMTTRPAHEVRLYKGDDLLLYFFVSSPDGHLAGKIADDRAVDFRKAFGWNDVRFETKKVE